MKIKRLVIENFKSIERIELIEPNPFTVFVGPNGSGKSNIFEALEFFNLSARTNRGTVESLFGREYFTNRKSDSNTVQIEIELEKSSKVRLVQRPNTNNQQEYTIIGTKWREDDPNETQQLVANFSRLFVGREDKQKLNYVDDYQLTLSTSNLEKVLKRVLSDETLKSEIFEWLELFVPEFKAVDVVANSFDGRDTLLWYEQYSDKPFTKDLISDGTYNILALLTAVYQSDEPQFLCIEEPENGLNPKVIKEFVNLCRYACEEFGHYIWLNTHSQTLVSQLTPDEIILVDKKEGATQTKQIKGMNLHGLPMDEAWLSNALRGGLPW
ncbi:AAA family ATPase [Spirosoma areae]